MTGVELQAIKARTELVARCVEEVGAWEEQLLSDAEIEDLIHDVGALVAEVVCLREDQAEWRKGVAFVASSAGIKTLSCSHLGMEVLKIRAEVERLSDKLSEWNGSAECGPGLCECDRR